MRNNSTNHHSSQRDQHLLPTELVLSHIDGVLATPGSKVIHYIMALCIVLLISTLCQAPPVRSHQEYLPLRYTKTSQISKQLKFFSTQ